MKYHALIALLVLGAAFAAAGCREGGKQVGQPAPDFSLKDLDGASVRLSNYRGKVVIVNFWATWCPPCREEIPDFVDLFTAYSGRGLVILGIGLDREGEKALKPFAEKYRIAYPLLVGNAETARAWGGVDAIPATFIIDRQGIVRKQYVGSQPKSVFEKEIVPLLDAR
ncbi:MAG: TlpA disulfide reductase family protein [Candidatus Aureabacteria bacterium]|nr:TlpA disulfide reductase family protein [Candidatus Auribacterota bacterium]